MTDEAPKEYPRKLLIKLVDNPNSVVDGMYINAAGGVEYTLTTHALALLAEAYAVAGAVCHNMHEDGLCGDTLTPDEAAVALELGDEVLSKTPADAIAAREARGAEVRSALIEDINRRAQNYYTQGQAQSAVQTFASALLAWNEDGDFALIEKGQTNDG